MSPARTYLATRDELHVIVVIDADSTDAQQVSDEHEMAMDLLGAARPVPLGHGDAEH